MTKDVRKVIKNQMSHVKKGCLSDPPATVVMMHRVNPVTGHANSGRSTGTCEVDNRQILNVLNTPSVGIARAARVVGDHYEQSNDRKKVTRLLEPEKLTHRTEKLYLLNSVAKSCGFFDEKLPVKEVFCPDEFPVKEYIGFEHDLPTYFRSDRQ
ncbi:hypothetical protein SEMRO_3097_G343660.1 [Seminavis robusta]|uniref:Uncharacterized protein n=1 Tax=Seminavis robusta TaxID=568900 RepID=A0A9N8EZD8_9STRA|nr:hypothetical protein SEMRO_3097_G343660.1 [Seminavis robusta]|eukprot:Sro3097_g343660.1 n/a (154) ;mRNA; r:7992-8453